jgi:hypothetical protein
MVIARVHTKRECVSGIDRRVDGCDINDGEEWDRDAYIHECVYCLCHQLTLE